MDEEQILFDLVTTAEEIGIEIRRAQIGGSDGGSLCKLKNKWVLFLDEGAPIIEQIDTTAKSLKGRPELENIYLRPQIREIIER